MVGKGLRLVDMGNWLFSILTAWQGDSMVQSSWQSDQHLQTAGSGRGWDRDSLYPRCVPQAESNCKEMGINSWVISVWMYSSRSPPWKGIPAGISDEGINLPYSWDRIQEYGICLDARDRGGLVSEEKVQMLLQKRFTTLIMLGRLRGVKEYMHFPW